MDYSTVLILGFLAISLYLDTVIARINFADAFGNRDEEEYENTYGDLPHGKSARHQDGEP